MLASLPNLLTLARIAAVPVVVALVGEARAGADAAAAIVFALAGITDWLDGWLARRWHAGSPFGRMLDPVADKILIGAALLMLAGRGRLEGAALYFGVVVLVRELLVGGLREHLAGAGGSLPVSKLAKWKTGAQMAAVGLLLLGDDGAAVLGSDRIDVQAVGLVALVAATLLSVVTGIAYVAATLRWVRGQHRNPGRVPIDADTSAKLQL